MGAFQVVFGVDLGVTTDTRTPPLINTKTSTRTKSVEPVVGVIAVTEPDGVPVATNEGIVAQHGTKIVIVEVAPAQDRSFQ